MEDYNEIAAAPQEIDEDAFEDTWKLNQKKAKSFIEKSPDDVNVGFAKAYLAFDDIVKANKYWNDFDLKSITSDVESLTNMESLKEIVRATLLEKKKKRDRCLRIADRRYKKPSAYKSGSVVRCRQGDIWKDLKEDNLNELDMSKFINSWLDTDDFKKADNFSESIFLYLKKNGYTNNGEIYRVLNLDPLIIIIKQNTEYIDLDKFLEDNQDIKPYDYLYSMFKHEKEVIARLDPNFSFEYIYHTDNTGSNFNVNSIESKRINANNFKNKLRQIILKKDQGKLLSFTKDRKAAQDYLEVLDDTLIQKYKEESNLEVEDNEFLNEDESLYKWFKRTGTPGKEGGWVDCNAPIRKDGKITGYKSCGRKEGEKRAKYPSCRPTAAKCKTPGKGTKWGKTK
jgi:hypothetical protein